MKLLRVSEAAIISSLSQKKIRSMVAERELDSVRIGRTVRIPESSLLAVIQQNLTPARVA
jgi:excisionase family DNA binding protein